MIDNQRFREMVVFLKKEHFIRNQQDFTERVQSNKSTISEIMNDRRSIPVNLFSYIERAFPFISIEWLKTGEGDMLHGEQDLATSNENALPYFEDSAFGCSPSGFSENIERRDAASVVTLPGLRNDGETFVVPARGESMVNTSNPERSIPNGSLVAIRKAKLSTPRWGEVYALATADGCIIKRLYPSEREGWVRCVSYNAEEYPAFELNTNEIYDIGIVVAVVNVTHWS